MKDIDDAEARLDRFALFIMKCFPETKKDGGMIESALTPVPKMQKYLEEAYGEGIPGNYFKAGQPSCYRRFHKGPRRYL